MRYDIVALKQIYRGIERSISHDDLLTKRKKNCYDAILDIYYAYIAETLQSPSEAGFLNLIQTFKRFQDYGIACEMIVYDVHPIQELFGYQLEFLGFDVVLDIAESILSGCDDRRIQQYLNENGLCDAKEDLKKVMVYLDHGGNRGLSCYVYKVLI